MKKVNIKNIMCVYKLDNKIKSYLRKDTTIIYKIIL